MEYLRSSGFTVVHAEGLGVTDNFELRVYQSQMCGAGSARERALVTPCWCLAGICRAQHLFRH